MYAMMSWARSGRRRRRRCELLGLMFVLTLAADTAGRADGERRVSFDVIVCDAHGGDHNLGGGFLRLCAQLRTPTVYSCVCLCQHINFY